jgi:hypothetical protein
VKSVKISKLAVCSAFLLMIFASGCADFGGAKTAQTNEAKLSSTAPVPTNDAEKVEIALVYKKQTGAASNQFAIWVEDEKGNYIKTIYATNFTARKGFSTRKESLPNWVTKAKVADMPKETVDAFSGATPSGGAHSYTWDFTGQDGKPVAAGVYKIILEGTLFWGNKVVYTAIVNSGEKKSRLLAVSKELFAKDRQNLDMLDKVSMTYSAKNS